MLRMRRWFPFAPLVGLALVGLALVGATPLTTAVAATGTKSYALVIGIDDYSDAWPRLNNAVAEARAVSEALKTLGFEVDLKTNVSGPQLHRLMLEFFVIKGADPDAKLLLWFAGHGETIDGEGYLVPSDAPISAKPQFLLTAMPVRMLGSFVRLAQARHVLAIFDACFAGTVFETRGTAHPRTLARINEPVREFLTSGGAGQRVRDDGSFKDYFLRAVSANSEADFNDDGLVTGSELGLYMSQNMTALTRSAQTPLYGKLHDTRFNRGDFFFSVGPGKSPRPAASDREMLFWDSIKWSAAASEYEAYLRQFPDGTYAALAQGRLSRLSAASVPGQTDAPGIWALDQTMTVVADTVVNLRLQPDLDAEIVERLSPGSEVSVTGRTESGTWYRLQIPGGRSGFVMGRYLQTLKTGSPQSPAYASHTINVTFGPPVNETVQLPFDPTGAEIRHTAYLKNGAIAWFDADIYADEMNLAIFVDSPENSTSSTFRHVFSIRHPNSAELANLTPDDIRTWGKIETAYQSLVARVDMTVQ